MGDAVHPSSVDSMKNQQGIQYLSTSFIRRKESSSYWELSLSLSLSPYLSLSLPISLSLSHTHTHTHTLSLPSSLSLSFTHTHTLSLLSSLSLTHTLSLFLSLSLSHTHTHSHLCVNIYKFIRANVINMKKTQSMPKRILFIGDVVSSEYYEHHIPK